MSKTYFKLTQSRYGFSHSPVDSSAPSILTPWVQVPSIPSIYIQIVSCGKDENKQKEVEIGPFLNIVTFC